MVVPCDVDSHTNNYPFEVFIQDTMALIASKVIDLLSGIAMDKCPFDKYALSISNNKDSYALTISIENMYGCTTYGRVPFIDVNIFGNPSNFYSGIFIQDMFVL